MTPAARLMDAVLSTSWRPEAWDEVQALATGRHLDWEELSALAAAEGVEPLLADRIGAAAWLPAAVRQRLQRSRHATAAHNALLFGVLDRLLGALQAAGIRPIVLKGPALIGTVYPSADLRPMGDLDLLVRHEAADAALEVLVAQGYGVLSGEAHPGSQLAFESEITLQRAEGSVPIVAELHWALIDSPFYRHGLPHEWFWATAAPIGLAGQRPSMLALGPEASVIYLAAHLVLHHTAGNQPHRLWRFDLAELIWRHLPASGARRPLDWELVVRQTEACHLVLAMQAALAQLAAWQVPVPGEVREAIGRLRPSRIEAQVFDQLTGPRHRSGRRFLVDMATLPRWRDRVRFAWQQVLPTPAYMRERYGADSNPRLAASYLRRWWRGLARIR